jgi:thiamine monophosphate synthase
VRLRSLVTLSTGAALGAGTMYLLDPDQGRDRRRDARRNAARETARRGVALALAGVDRAGTVAEAAVYGYHAGRDDAAVERERAARPGR